MKIDKTRNMRRFSWLSAVVVALMQCALSVHGEDWGPVLAAPTIGIDAISDDYVPNRIVSRVAAKRLPANGRSAQGHGQPVGYDMPPSPPRGSVIPQNFLDEESIPAPIAPSKSPKKVPRPLIDVDDEMTFHEDEILYEDDIVLPGARRRFLVAEATSAATPTSWAETDDVVQEFDDVYEGYSPMMNYGYTTCPIVRPFGTGSMDNLTFFGGMAGFRNELDLPEKGNFGFMEGVNWAGPATPQQTVSAQVGFRAVQSNLYGSIMNEGLERRKSVRDQYFITAGFFKRDLGSPIQAGAVYDWGFDEFYGNITLQQVRVEASLRTFSNLEYGFQGAFGTTKERSRWISRLVNGDNNSYYRAQNCYFLFGRKHFVSGGLGELRIGATDRGDVIVGGLGEFPINDRLSMSGGFSLLCPKEGNNRHGWRRETWEVSVGMIFYFRGGACSKPINPCRPMFDVAGNGSFFGRLHR